LTTLRVAPLLIVRVLVLVALLVAHLKLLTVALTPAARMPAPVASLTVVPPLDVPIVRALLEAPRFPPAPTESVPLLTATGPVKVLAPVRLSVPGPARMMPEVPAMGAAMVGLRPAATFTAPGPTKVSV